MEKTLGEGLLRDQLKDVSFSFRLNNLGILAVRTMHLVVGVGEE